MHRTNLNCRLQRRRVLRHRRQLQASSRPRGFTLVELLVAMAVTLILIFALAQAFALVGDVVADGRATVEISGSMRSVANRLQQDLEGVTAPVRPWLDPAAGLGYFEIIDGPSVDADWNYDGVIDTDPLVSNTTFGDVDDILAFTTRSDASPFVGTRTYVDSGGNTITQTIKSPLAEVVWWIQYDDASVVANGVMNRNGNGVYDLGEPFTIYRRALLVRPDLGVVFNQNYTDLNQLRTDLINFFNTNDISVRMRWWTPSSGGGTTVELTANSLADLTARENRFAHMPVLLETDATGTTVNTQSPFFPYPMLVNRRSVTSLYRSPKTDGHMGEDVMLVNALAFDVRVFDPGAAVGYNVTTGEALTPGDPGYFNGGTAPFTPWPTLSAPVPNCMPAGWWIGFGAFVDLGYAHGNTSGTARWNVDTAGTAPNLGVQYASSFSGVPASGSGLDSTTIGWGTPCYSYCTWSMDYERNGVDEDGNGVIDQGTNGFDDDGANGVDDVGERETSPPYPVPLRGIRVSIRAIEPGSRQVKQVSVMSDFLPE